MNSYKSDQIISQGREQRLDESIEDKKITEQEFLEACQYRHYVLCSYGLKPVYPQWYDAIKYTKCLDIIKRYHEQQKRTPED